MILICEECKKEFEWNTSRKRFCNDCLYKRLTESSSKYKKRKRKERQPFEKICKECNKPFLTKNNAKKYCCQDCRDTSIKSAKSRYDHNRYAKKKQPRYCKLCGALLGKNYKYCEKCKKQLNRDAAQKWYNENKLHKIDMQNANKPKIVEKPKRKPLPAFLDKDLAMLDNRKLNRMVNW